MDGRTSSNVRNIKNWIKTLFKPTGAPTTQETSPGGTVHVKFESIDLSDLLAVIGRVIK